MAELHLTGRQIHRLPPCPAYDVEGMERWLEDMAEKGFFLAKDGFFAGVAAFDCGEGRRVKYRLAAAPNRGGVFSDDMGAPDAEQLELSRQYAWEYLDRRGEFHIYRCLDPEARELNTDPEVEALALNAVKKRRRAALALFIYYLPHLFLATRGAPLLAVIAAKSWVALLWMLLLAWVIARTVRELRFLRRFQRALRGQAPEPPRRSPAAYFIGKWTLALLFLLLFAMLFHALGVTLDGRDRVSLSRYEGEIPFATLADIAGGEVLDYTPTMSGMGTSFNTLSEHRDLLAPRWMNYTENADLLTTVRPLYALLKADWFELRSPFLARLLAKDLRRTALFQRGCAPLALPELPVDYASAYTTLDRFPTVVLQKGNKVLRATFFQYQSSAGERLTLEEWTLALAESLDG